MGLKIKIYLLLDPRNGNIFYVGATKSTLHKRLSAHLYSNSTRNKKDVLIKDILKSGYHPKIKLLKEVLFKDADYWERKYYNEFIERGFTLLQSNYGFTYTRQQHQSIINKRTKDPNDKISSLERTVINLPEDILIALEELADADGRPVKNYIERIIINHVKMITA